MKLFFAALATVFVLIGNASYVKDTLQEKVKPHPYTWFVWSIVSCVVFFGQLQRGAGIGAIPTGVSESFTLIIFFLSLKPVLQGAVWHIRKVDSLFLVISLLGLIPWALTKDPTVSIITVVAIDLIAFVPTMRKAWHHPHTEKPFLYEMNVTRHILTLFSLQAYNIATTLHSVVMIFANTLMAWFVKRDATEQKTPVV